MQWFLESLRKLLLALIKIFKTVTLSLLTEAATGGVLCKKVFFLKNFKKLTGKHLTGVCFCLFFTKVACLSPDKD